MPFTPTHILAVVPFYYFSRKLSLAALAIGSMIPDMPMFFTILSYEFSHSIQGIFLYCLPLGLCSFLFFDYCGKTLLIELCPDWIRLRLIDFQTQRHQYDFYNLMNLILAILLGIVTHVTWDAFTHEGSWGVNLVPQLSERYSLGADIQLYGYKMLQYGSSLIGIPCLILLSYWVLKSKVPSPIYGQERKISNQTLTIIRLVILISPLIILCFYSLKYNSIYHIIGATIIKAISLEIILFVVFSFILKKTR